MDRDCAWSEFLQLAEAHNARVWVAPKSGRCSFPEEHPLFAGFLPAIREKIVALLEGHDLIFVIGAPAFTYMSKGSGLISRKTLKFASLLTIHPLLPGLPLEPSLWAASGLASSTY